MKKFIILTLFALLPFVLYAVDESRPVMDATQVRKGSEADTGPNWFFYSLTGIAFMSVYYGLKKVVMEIGGDSGR